MLKKSNYEEPGPVSAQPLKKDSPTIIKTSAMGSAESPVTIAARNDDIPPVQRKHLSVLGSTLVFKGELSADEEILIQGTVEGTIAHNKKDLTVGNQGRVRALIHANSVTIQGRVDGDIHGDVFVVLTEGCEVNGDIFCPRIIMEDGAVFNGTIHMTY